MSWQPVNPAAAVVTAEEFAADDEPGGEPLVGDADNALLGEGFDIMWYGDGGAGKTTLSLDAGCHFAAGDPWLGMTTARKMHVLFLENEGPRPLFRRKLRRKLAGWTGSPLEGRILVWQEPWATFTFADPEHRRTLADQVREHQIDIVFVGPVTAAGMEAAGTLQDVRAFAQLLADVREQAGRQVAFVLIHHENKAGNVSGAWEGCGDTLLHVQGLGHGRTRVYVKKARWASALHATTLELVWADGDSFTLENKPELDDAMLGEKICEHVRADPGTAWGKVEKAVTGVGNDRLRAVRDGLFAADELVNLAKVDGADVLLHEVQERRAPRLFLADDPTIAHLRQGSGAAPAQAAPLWGAAAETASAPCAPPYRGAGVGAVQIPPSKEPLETQQ